MSGREKMLIGWALLMGVPIFVVFWGFLFMEGYALLQDDPTKAITLSRASWEVNEAWPLAFPLASYLIGSVQWGFAVHVLWHWEPRNPNDRRG